MGRGGRNVTKRSRIVSVVPHVAIFYSTGVEHCSPVRYCLRFRLDSPKDNWLVLGVPMNEAVPEAPASVESMAEQGCEKLGLEAFDALVRRARTCRRFDESMRVPREFLLELAEAAIPVVEQAPTVERLKQALADGWVPIVLISTWRFDQRKYLESVISGRGPGGGSPGFNQGGKGNSGPPPGPMGTPSGGSSTTPPVFAQPNSPYTGGAPVGVDGYTQFQRDLLEAIELNSAKTSVDVSNQARRGHQIGQRQQEPHGRALRRPRLL